MTIPRISATPASAFMELQGMWAELNMGMEPDDAFKRKWNALAEIARNEHIVPKYPEPRERHPIECQCAEQNYGEALAQLEAADAPISSRLALAMAVYPMKTMMDHAQTCAHYGDSMMPCTCGAEPDIIGCHYDDNGKLQPGLRPRVITRVMDDGIKTKDGVG